MSREEVELEERRYGAEKELICDVERRCGCKRADL